MKNIKESLIKTYGDKIKKYRITFITTIIFTILLVLYDISNTDLVDELFEGICLFGPASFLLESITNENKKIKIGCIINLLVCAFLTILLNKNLWFYGFSQYGCTIFITFIVTIFFIIKNKNVSKYLKDITRNAIEFGFYMVVVWIGLVVIYVVGTSLLDIDYEFANRIVEIVMPIYFGLGVLPSIIIGLNKSNETLSKQMETFIKILYIFLIILVVIILLYLFKVIISIELPSNEIFSVTALSFVLGMYALLMNENIEESSKFKKYIPYVFVILIPFQIVSISMRVSAYGLTTTRYWGIMFIIVEIAFFILLFYKNKKYLVYLIPVIAVLMFIGNFVPYISAYDASFFSQEHIINETYKESFSSLSEEDKRKVLDAYDYLEVNSYEWANSILENGAIAYKFDKNKFPEDLREIYYNNYYNYWDEEF